MVVRIREHVWIPLRDGRRLSARMVMPQAERPCPVIIEYNPYRCHDITRELDRQTHTFFAESGYVSIRVDLMGTGNSDGVLTDEYTPQEIQDLEDVILFAGSRPWCSGSVGLLGFSWGAYSAMLVAMRRPPFLKAIIAVMGSDDRFDECVHYNGGCLLASNFVWASFMQIYAALPPDPAIVGSDWLDIWKKRLAAQPLWASQWLRHRKKDAYWAQGSVSADYSAVDCPIHVFAGTADRYKEAGFRLFDNCRSFIKVTMGPWEHCYPHKASPHPIDFPREAVRWWDCWLKGVETGIDHEPKITAWMEHSEGHGYWFATDATASNSTLFPLDRTPLAPLSSDTDWVLRPHDHIERPPHAGEYMRLSSPALTESTDVFGKPVLQLTFARELPDQQLIARLFEVRRDGKEIEIARGSRRFATLHEDSMELGLIARRIDAGSYFTITLSAGLWPAIVPMPWSESLDTYFRGAQLRLPVSRPLQERNPATEFHDEPSPNTIIKAAARKTVSVTENPQIVRLSANAGIFGDFVRARFVDIETEIEHTFNIEYRNGRNNSSIASQNFKLERKDWKIELSASFALASKADAHRLTGNVEAHHNDKPVYRKDWPPEIIDSQ